MNRFSYFILILTFPFFSCKLPKGKYTSPEGYNLKKPDKFKMPSSLLEISGIAFQNMNADTVYSIQDEDGRLFRQAWGIKKQKNIKFAPSGDYEDLAIAFEQVFILKSSGTIYSFPFSETTKKKTGLVKEYKRLVPKAEYESLYADAGEKRLYILCKSCDSDKKKKQLTGYRLAYDQVADTLTLEGSFSIALDQLEKKLKTGFHPSALTKNPMTGEWYILSSMNKLLVITDASWKIKEAHHLNASTFNQPEGIAFDEDNNLYISNEGDEITDGNILKFGYK